jgi:uncharacterized protein (TIGR01319 family)
VTAAICVDVGSTFTKAAAVDLASGELIGTASHPTTLGTDVLDGVDVLTEGFGLPGAQVLACSSAGGGLRLAVIGYEALITADAARRVGLSAGARIVHVAAGPLGDAGLAEVAASHPDLLLLAGGTDGGNADVLLHNASALATARLGVPVVVAGNAAAGARVEAVLSAGGQAVVRAENLLPRIGELAPGPARAAVRQAFLSHVIGGKGLSAGPRFVSLVRGPTPDVVLTAVELLAGLRGDVVAVDIGGATTDVYSAVTPDPEEAGLRRAPAGVLWHNRTVEADLGVRWSAPGVVAAAAAERLGGAELAGPAAQLAADPRALPASAGSRDADQRLAQLAAVVALRRHARAAPGSPARDLRQIRLVIASGGVVRHSARPAAILAPALADHAGGWLLPADPLVVADVHYVLAAAGLLAGSHPDAAARLLSTSFPDRPAW